MLTSKCGFATLLVPHGGRPALAGLGALMRIRHRQAIKAIVAQVGRRSTGPIPRRAVGEVPFANVGHVVPCLAEQLAIGGKRRVQRRLGRARALRVDRVGTHRHAAGLLRIQAGDDGGARRCAGLMRMCRTGRNAPQATTSTGRGWA